MALVWQLALIVVAVATVEAVPADQFYPFGPLSGDETLESGDDVSTSEVNLGETFVFFGSYFRTIYVNVNGHVSFDSEIPDYRSDQVLPLGMYVIAVFLADVDTRAAGRVYYRSTSDPQLLQRAAMAIRTNFTGYDGFTPSALFIVTWDRVGYYQEQADKVNTFQLVLASNGKDTFAFFHYLDDGIQWLTSQGKFVPTYQDTPPQAGFDDGAEHNYFLLPGSAESGVFVNGSNVNIPGVWLHYIGNGGIKSVDLNIGEGQFVNVSLVCERQVWGSANSTIEDFDLEALNKPRNVFTSRGNKIISPRHRPHAKYILLSFPNIIKLCLVDRLTLFDVKTAQDSCFQLSATCHPKAQCIDHDSGGVCCVCIPPSYGNGFHCLEPGVPQKLNGRVHGHLNGVPLDDDLLMHTYVVTTDGRTYSAISRVPTSLGAAMQALNSIGGIIGWIFAIPLGDRASNGYSLTGAVLNRTARVTFHTLDRGDYVVRIHQVFSGSDSLSNIRMETKLEGNLPDIPLGATVSVDDYNEIYKRTAPGTIKSFVARTYRVNDVAYRYSWDNTITFQECQNQPLVSPNDVMRLSVTRHYVKHSEQERVVRFAMTSKIGVFSGDADQCTEAAQSCDQNADCVLQGSSYKCLCRPGFSGDGDKCEADVRFCGQSICDRNARCTFTGATNQPECVCSAGFRGDGTTCVAIDVSCNEANICGDNAKCVYDEVLRRYYCECTEESSGDDASSCEPARTGCADCDENARCEYDTSRNSYTCQCGLGYTGDGRSCTLIDTCSRCDSNARCLFNNETSDYECVCARGYTGDGSSCQLQDCREDLSVCDPVGGLCWLDADRNFSFCRCNYGYRGDGFKCQPTGCDVYNDCDEHAMCESDGSRFVCQCNDGFVGDGKTCREDALATRTDCSAFNNCDTNARCVPDTDQPSQYTCKCNPGYQGDGNICLLRFPCNQVNNCDHHAECVYDPDILSYACQCSRGYEGDGLMCLKREVVDCRRTPGMCSTDAECVRGVDYVYVCVCMPGYRGDGATCSSVVHEGNYLVYAQGNTVMRVSSENTTGDYGQQLVYIPGMLAVGVDTDCQEGDVYWTDAAMGNIRHAKLNGSSVETLVTGLKSPEGVAIDFVARNMFFTDSELDTLQVARLDGSSIKTLVNTDMVNPRAIVLDINRGVIFWTDWNRNQPQIEKVNMDGTQRQVLVAHGLGLPNGLALDVFSQTLCWGDAGTHSIECIRSDGEGRRMVHDKATYPFDITVLNNIIYWTDWRSKDIPNVNQNGGEVNQALKQAIGGNGRLYGITSVKDQCPRVRSPCGLNNGGCKFLCLASANGGRTCVCPDGVDPRICQPS